MMYRMEEKENDILLFTESAIDLRHIARSGQCFRWDAEDDKSYSIVSGTHFVNASDLMSKEKGLMLKGSTLQEVEKVWVPYFDLTRDYESILDQFASDDAELKRAIDYARGMRILQQDAFETVISFIISANNNIIRISRACRAIAESFGPIVRKNGASIYYAFPTPEALAHREVSELRELGLGYRAPYVLSASRMIAQREVDLSVIHQMETPQARTELMRLPGVGPKVADCILLFAYHRLDAFPVDTWVNKWMERHILKKTAFSRTRIRDYGMAMFGENAGIAQQYMFYYAKEHKINNK